MSDLLSSQYIGQMLFGVAVAVAISGVAARIASKLNSKDVAANAQGEEIEIEQPKGAPAGAGHFTRKLTPQERQERKEHHDRTERYIKLGVGIFLSVVILIPCLYLVITSNNAEQEKWAQSTIALILGYWLKAIT